MINAYMEQTMQLLKQQKELIDSFDKSLPVSEQLKIILRCSALNLRVRIRNHITNVMRIGRKIGWKLDDIRFALKMLYWKIRYGAE